MHIKFNHIGDGKLAAFRGERAKGRNRKIIFPQGFDPKEDVVYDVEIHRTKFGVYVHDNEKFDICHARPTSAADMFDEISVLCRTQPPLQTVAEALSALNLKI